MAVTLPWWLGYNYKGGSKIENLLVLVRAGRNIRNWCLPVLRPTAKDELLLVLHGKWHN